MKNESGPASASSVPEEPPTFRQKRREGESTFTFFPEHLDYTFAGLLGFSLSVKSTS